NRGGYHPAQWEWPIPTFAARPAGTFGWVPPPMSSPGCTRGGIGCTCGQWEFRRPHGFTRTSQVLRGTWTMAVPPARLRAHAPVQPSTTRPDGRGKSRRVAGEQPSRKRSGLSGVGSRVRLARATALERLTTRVHGLVRVALDVV